MPYTPWVEQSRNLFRNPSFEKDLAGLSYNRVVGTRVTDWKKNGSYSLALTRTADTNSDSYAEISAMIEAAPGKFGPAFLKPNTLYTIEATYHLLAPFASVPEGATTNLGQRISLFVHLNGATLLMATGVNSAGTRTLRGTFTTPAVFTGYNTIRLYGGDVASAPSRIRWDGLALFEGNVQTAAYDGDTPDPSRLEAFSWVGTPHFSPSTYNTREFIKPGLINTAIKERSVEDVLYNDRSTSYRWEVLTHFNGVDQLVGLLDGAAAGSLNWTQNASVKGAGKLAVTDLESAAPGLLRVADLSLESVRLRPVRLIKGLPEDPLGIFLVSAATEQWTGTGRVWSLELLDRCTVPAQDKIEGSFSVPAGARILRTVRDILLSSNEYIEIDSSSTLATSTGMVWEAGTSKLTIINDLLDVAGFNALWIDGYGNFQLTPRVLPANRSLTYDLLGVPRELKDGEQSIYQPEWTRDKDSFEVPNKVIAVQAAGGVSSAALVGVWTNEDPSSPYSYASRGRWIPHVLDSVDTPEGTAAATMEFLRNRARATLVQMSAVQAQLKITHLPIPVRVSDVIRFAHAEAGIDSRHVVTKIQLDTSPLGMMSSTLQEVISL